MSRDRHARMARAATLLAGSALLPVAALNLAPGAPAMAATPASFDPPRARLLLTRTLHSPLADGREIVSRRTYEVTIVPEGEGWRVDGRQVEAAVDAPPALRPLAELERNRIDGGLFPLRLDARGLIVPGSASAAPPPPADMVRHAARYAETVGADPSLRPAAQAVVQGLQQKPALSAWPADLFHAMPGRRTDSGPVSLPDGRVGTVTVEGETRLGGAPGMLSSLQRVVTTELGASRRVVREEWTLRLAD